MASVDDEAKLRKTSDSSLLPPLAFKPLHKTHKYPKSASWRDELQVQARSEGVGSRGPSSLAPIAPVQKLRPYKQATKKAATTDKTNFLPRLYWSRDYVKAQPLRRKDAALQKLLNSKKQREQFRKKLVHLIFRDEDEEEDDEAGKGFFNTKDRLTLRYYYYIHNGIDTRHVTPLADQWMDNILASIAPHLKSDFKEVLEEVCNELRTSYLFYVKKATVDFVLGDSRRALDIGACIPQEESHGGLQIPGIDLEKTRKTLCYYLHVTNPCLRQMQELWDKSYRDFTLINVDEIRKIKKAIELSTLMQIISNHIDQGKHELLNKWMSAVENILLVGGKRRHVPDSKTQRKRFHSFVEAVNTLMCHHLQTMCLQTIQQMTRFLCYEKFSEDHHPTFILYLVVEEGNIRYRPQFSEFETEFLSIFDLVVAAACSIPRMEHKLYPEWKSERSGIYLRPIILPEIVAQAKLRVSEVIKHQSTQPNAFLATFDKHQFIINKQICEAASDFLNKDRSFSEFEDKVKYYCNLIQSIQVEAVKTNQLGLFEVWGGEMIERLVAETEVVKERLLRQMIDDEQILCQRLCGDYHETADRLSVPPASTQELTILKANDK